MPATYDRIASQTVTGSAASAIQFSDIPSTYTDLVVIVSAKQTGTPTGTDAFVTLNGNGASIYSRTVLIGDGVSATSSRATNMDRAYFPVSPQTSDAIMIFNFNNYSNTSTNKAMLMRYSGSPGVTYASGYLFASTAAISIIAFTASDRMGAGVADSWDIGSTFTIYGIRAA
jgi:hypothetical protein